MKKLLLYTLTCFILISTYSQDSSKIKRIDSIVAEINRADLKLELDSIRQDQPEYGIKMTTYVTAAMDGIRLRKYINNPRGTTTQNGVTTNINTYNIFYFDDRQLIKVEELAIMKGKKVHIDWYYENDSPLVAGYKSGKSTERAFMLLKLGKQLMQQYEQLK